MHTVQYRFFSTVCGHCQLIPDLCVSFSDISGRGAAPGTASLQRQYGLFGLESAKLMLLMSTREATLPFSLKVSFFDLVNNTGNKLSLISKEKRFKWILGLIRNITRLFHITGDHYWGIRGNTVLPGYPKPLSDFGLPSSVTKVDAAVYVTFIGRTLIFVKNKYWRWVISVAINLLISDIDRYHMSLNTSQYYSYSYNERRGKMDGGFPKFIHRELPGIGYRVDAAFANRGR